MFDSMSVFKAIADANRVRILCVLQGRELCVCQIIEMLGLAPSTISKHLAILRQARLLDDRKEGRWMYYRHPDHPSTLVRNILSLLKNSLADAEQVKSDRKHITEILSVERENLCRAQNRKQS